MSQKYPGGFITKSPATPTGPLETGTAPGIWTLDQQLQYQKQGIWPTAGNVPLYIEDVFQTWLYNGNSSTQSIVNGIDLSTKGGMVWTKSRNATYDNTVYDTARGTGSTKALYTNTTNAEGAFPSFQDLTAYNTNGYSIGSPILLNETGKTYVSWTFRKQPKFFDIVTYTGNGTAGRTIAHNLGSVPGCMIVKCTSSSSIWSVYHRSTGGIQVGILEGTNAFSAASAYWNNTDPTSTVFTVGGASAVNDSGQTFVAYLFAHDAGGFGLTQTDNVISCGSYTGNGSTTGPTITLGWEPQWLMIKKSSAISGSESWAIWDNMRNSGLWNDWLIANDSQAEQVNNSNVAVQITATGFFPNATNNTANSYVNTSGSTYIYVAIRRGPMKIPTVGTTVFSPQTSTTDGFVMTTNFPVDLFINKQTNGTDGFYNTSRLTDRTLQFSSTGAESNYSAYYDFDSNTSVTLVAGLYGTQNRINYALQRSPSVFDVVAYTGTGVARTVSHNLTTAPEMMIVKRRSSSADWPVYHVAMGATKYTFLDGSTELTGTMWNNTTPTSSVFSVDSSYYVNDAASTYVAYLFATCAGVSKVGSYTGTGALQTINCGFTTGARFVLIHRIDSGSNNWFTFDSAQGITSGNDPYVALNSFAAQVTGTNYVDTTSVGFQVTAAAPSGLNASGGTYIFLAIA